MTIRPESIEDVLVFLHSGQWFGWGGGEKIYENLIIHSADGKPDEEWLEAELKRQQDAYDNDHTWRRKAEYPSIDELVVALWEGVVEERMAAVTKLEAKRQAVKLKHPK
jgi:hypothetical protein